MDIPDYYEFLQISPTAEPETIHRVYRFLAARLHPDNQETGDAAKFFLLKEAYETLSNPQRRAAYDASREADQSTPLSNWVDFMDNMEGEMNRRLALLAILYFQRRTNPNLPEVSFRDIEKRLGFPRDYLEFTAWYLRTKGYISRGDNSAFTITAEGVDFVETQRVNLPLLDKLLTTGDGTFAPRKATGSEPEVAAKAEKGVHSVKRMTEGNGNGNGDSEKPATTEKTT